MLEFNQTEAPCDKSEAEQAVTPLIHNMMLLFNLLKQLNAMPVNEATEALDALTGFTINPMKDPFTWEVTIIRHGSLEIAEITLSAGGMFVAEDFAQRNSEIYKFRAVNNVFGEEISVRIALAVQIESNYKLN